MESSAARETVRDFIISNFIFDEKSTLDDDQSLLGSGVVDSTGILELIAFLEQTFGTKFKDDELVADNFDSVNKVVAFVAKKNPGTTS